MAAHSFKTVGIPRVGLEYQDLIGIQILISFFQNPHAYQWVQIESEDLKFGYLDDIVASRADGSFELTQVKFTADPSRYALDWDWLLEKKSTKNTSLLAKWGQSLAALSAIGDIHSARLKTNRRPDTAFGASLCNGFVVIEQIAEGTRRKVEAELGGPAKTAAFFQRFEFSHSEPLVDELESQLKALVIPAATNVSGWLQFREQARRWATRKNEPPPDGRITHGHLLQIITKKRPQPIPQDFQIPDGYSPPSPEFHQNFLKRITSGDDAISVLWGSPGRGKSTYLSFVAQHLRQHEVGVIRHHYFLSLDDPTSDRVSFTDIAVSLIDQMSIRYRDAVEGLEDTPNDLRKWLEACGTYFTKKGKQFLVVIDGLDHVWREQGHILQLEQLFNNLLPCPTGVGLIVGTQRVPDSQLPLRLIQSVSEEDWIQIPSMNEHAVYQWISIQAEAGRVRFEDGHRASHEMRSSEKLQLPFLRFPRDIRYT